METNTMETITTDDNKMSGQIDAEESKQIKKK